MEEPECDPAREHIFQVNYTVCKLVNKTSVSPITDGNGNPVQFDLFLPATESELEEASRFVEEHGDGDHPVYKRIGCGKYDLPIREMTIIDISSLNSSAEMIAQMSPEQVRQLTEEMKDFEYEYDMEAACKVILNPGEAMSCSL